MPKNLDTNSRKNQIKWKVGTEWKEKYKNELKA